MSEWFRMQDARKDHSGRFTYHRQNRDGQGRYTDCGRPWFDLNAAPVPPTSDEGDTNPRYCERCRSRHAKRAK